MEHHGFVQLINEHVKTESAILKKTSRRNNYLIASEHFERGPDMRRSASAAASPTI